MVEEFFKSISIVFYEALCCGIFLNMFLEQRYPARWLKSLSVFLLTGVFLFWALITQTGGHYVFRSIGIIISIALFAVIFYTGKWLLKIFLSFIFYAILFCVDYLGLILVDLLLDSADLSNSVIQVILVLLCKTVLFVIVLILDYFWKREKELDVKKSEWILMISFPMMTVVIMLVMLLSFQQKNNSFGYLICVYDGGKKISDAVVTGTSYDYIYNNETAGKTLGFTVTARENASLAGEASRMVYNTDSRSEWVYTTPMQETRKNASAAALDGKIYVLGGENATGSLKTFAVYDTEKKTWESLPEYPGTESGICRAAVFAYNNEIYVIGGQTDTGVTAKLLKSVYAYNTETRQWQKKADLAEGRTNLAYACSKDKLYVWSKAGTTDQAEIYDIKTDTWETAVLPDTSAVIAAASVDNRVFVLKEDGEKMFWQEYLPEDNLFEDAGTVCPFVASNIYGTPVVISGKIYMAKTEETKEVLVYDAYSDEWSRISDMNLTKKDSMLAASGNDIYSIGGELVGFGVLDTVEQYTVKVQTITKQMAVNQGESYELQVNAGNLKKGQAKIVTVNVNPEEMKIQNASSFETEDTLKEGADGVTLLKYQPKKGVIVLKLTGSLERGESYETYQSIPVEAKITGKTTVEITLTEEGK